MQNLGGGKKQQFSMDMLNYVQTKGSDRIVVGTFFEKLASLSLPPTEMCPHLVCAIMKNHATRGLEPSETNGFASNIKAAEIAKVFSKSKAMCLEAEGAHEEGHRACSGRGKR